MSYSLEELFDDHIKTASDIDDLFVRLESCRRQDWVCQFVLNLVGKLAGTDTDADTARWLLENSFGRLDTACVITEDGDTLIISGILPNKIQLTIINDAKE